MKNDLTADFVRAQLSYDPESGIFRRKVRPCNRVAVGSVAGSTDTHGYVQIRLKGKPRLAHRLAWMYFCGTWPLKQIDHINGNRSDNRIINLREASNAENSRNNRAKGFFFNKERRKYQAQIRLNGKTIHLGLFMTPGEARLAYEAASLKHFGAFSAVRP